MATAPTSVPLSSTEPEAPQPAIAADFPSIIRAIAILFRGLKELSRRVANVTLGDGTHASRAGDLDAAYITVLSPAKPDEEFEVAHFLGRAPIGFDVCKLIGKPAIFYASGTEYTHHGWDDQIIRLKCNTADAMALLRVY